VRTVREGLEYAVQREKLGLDVRRLDEVQESVIWGVSSSAEVFTPVAGTDLRVIPMAEFPGVPALRVFFRIVDQDQPMTTYNTTALFLRVATQCVRNLAAYG